MERQIKREKEGGRESEREKDGERERGVTGKETGGQTDRRMRDMILLINV